MSMKAHAATSPLDQSYLFNARIENKPFACIFSFLDFFDVDAIQYVNKDSGIQCRNWQQLHLEKPLQSLSMRTGFLGCTFLTTNEKGMSCTFASLAKIKKTEGVHIGVSGLH